LGRSLAQLSVGEKLGAAFDLRHPPRRHRRRTTPAKRQRSSHKGERLPDGEGGGRVIVGTRVLFMTCLRTKKA
jgi:hypothetical protein